MLTLKRVIPDGPVIRIGGADKNQELPASIVVISLVRSTKGCCDSVRRLGIMEEEERINYMLSRGKNLIILVGSLEHFKEGNCALWNRIIRMADVRDV
jgi:AAA domain